MRRSTTEWALRGGFATVALVLGYVSTTQTLAFSLSKSDLERAYALAPGDGRIVGALARKIAMTASTSADRARANSLARRALAAEPLAVDALTALAIDSQVAGNAARARRLFTHSNTLSRREFATRLWLIEDAVARGDIKGALRHYDIALRTEKSAPDFLFPVLAQAIADPEVSDAVVETLSSKPAWGESLTTYLATSGEAPTASAALLRSLSRRGIDVPSASQTGVVNMLVRANKFDDGWNYYRSFKANADRRRSRDPDFAMHVEAPSVFDWVPIMSDAGITASIQRTSGGGGVFDFAAASSTSGIVLQQVQLLPPGRYRLEGISAEIEQPRATRPYWQLSCIDGREVGRIDVPNSAENGGRFIGIFEVSSDCPAQTLNLIARPSSEIGGSKGQMLRAMLFPLQKDK